MDNLHGELMEQVKVREQINEDLKDVEKEFRKQSHRKVEESLAMISK